MKQRVFLVSPPRSGNQMLVDFLHAIFNPIDFCGFYSCLGPSGQLACEATNWPHSMKYGCRAGHVVQKNHDFELLLPVSDQFRYVVTLRHPLYSLTSWYTHWSKTAPAGTSFQPLREFMVRKADYWRDFAQKWVDGHARPNVLYTRYEDLIRFPDEIRRVAVFMNGDAPPEGLAILNEDWHRSNVHQDRDLETEPSTDPALFAKVQHRIGLGLMARCGFEEMKFSGLVKKQRIVSTRLQPGSRPLRGIGWWRR